MKTVFLDGNIMVEYTLDQVRKNAKIPDVAY
jgi:hypothetical protein